MSAVNPCDAQDDREAAGFGGHIDIVFDGAPGPEGPRFVEVENGRGASIKVGEWIERADGFWVLRIPELPRPSVDLCDPSVLAGLACEEASTLSRETFIPCGAPAAAVVWHRRDGKHTYLMCAACAWHNVRNRGGRLLMATDRRAIP